ncbi:putative transporter protein SLAC1/Mae1/ Ssu1/TehA [Helianthus annuus]|nr:putative transporter protein SLAC1/Mae1/ Ssu1/TehA [Helianthus annuus]KAJ0848134.1 putative voltage-dependent anion channel [Helianthus annuus]KAJ0857085.1 putative transporter protein SLAC1/Mae1/ Ssu1/TehA [Helianthus annuus]
MLKEMAQNLGMKKEVIPSLIRSIEDNEVVGFDDNVMKHCVLDVELMDSGENKIEPEISNDSLHHHRTPSISISMPSSPMEGQNPKRVAFNVELVGKNEPEPEPEPPTVSTTKFHSQPMPTGVGFEEAVAVGKFPKPLVRNPRIDNLKDERFTSFKTWSGKLERQLSTLRGKPPSEPPVSTPRENVPVDRYFDALEGPELDILRPSEEIILPEDKKWPFLLRYPISSFGICLGVSSQAIMWKNLALTESTHFLHVSPNVNLVLWCISVVLFAVVAAAYLLKIILYFEAVRREYYHPIRVNFFFAPWIALLFLAIGVPAKVTTELPHFLWYVLMTPIFILELKIYGQWMSGGQRRLSKVANPSNHLSVVGNFVGALLGASMGLKEGPIFFFAVGMAHYTVLFVTLYQRLPTNETLPKELHPVFFLFVAAPSVASMAWARINDSFDYGSRIAYFIAMFLYFSLAVRVNFFRGFKFSLAWWAYTFPMTGAAIATIRYTSEVSNIVTKLLSVGLTTIATLTVFGLLVTTILHAFVMRDLFPNDIAIAISDRKPKTVRKWFHRRAGSSEKDIEHYLKYVTSNEKDVVEASVTDKDVESQTPLP